MNTTIASIVGALIAVYIMVAEYIMSELYKYWNLNYYFGKYFLLLSVLNIKLLLILLMFISNLTYLNIKW